MILTIYLSCTDKKDKINIVEKTKKEKLSSDQKFKNWLIEKSILYTDIKPFREYPSYELWSHYDLLSQKDSLKYDFFPSTDSSFVLITNENRENRGRYIDYRFLETESKNVHIGIGIMDSLKTISTDHFWYNDRILYIIERKIKSNDYSMIKLKVKVDSIWEYYIPNDEIKK
ncbi:hypothetical protein [Lutibacter oricola]|uniref:hypothetical protein n=1 Tax=Lutibacter oricola TaxID=762486 RepID=UPI0011144BDA|nr:hypothetical protein [Lutibacter oricola]